MSLDLSRLENVRQRGRKVEARCPACKDIQPQADIDTGDTTDAATVRAQLEALPVGDPRVIIVQWLSDVAVLTTWTTFTEYWDVHTRPNGDQWMVVTNTVDDPINLQIPWITSLHFKKEPDGGKWTPTPCSARF